MSLKPDDRSARSRSKSPGRTRDRSRSRSNVRAPEIQEAPEPPTNANYGYPPPPPSSGAGYPDAYGNGVTSPSYDIRTPQAPGAERPDYFRHGSSASQSYGPPAGGVPYPQDDDHGFGAGYPTMPAFPDDDLAYGAVESPGPSRHASFAESPFGPQSAQIPSWPAQPGESRQPYQYRAEPVTSNSRSSSYTYQYAQPPDKITYKPLSDAKNVQYTRSPYASEPERLPRNYRSNSYGRESPGDDKRDRKSSKSSKDSKSKSVRLSVDRKDSSSGGKTLGLGPRMDLLSVSGDRPDVAGLGGPGGLPPPSPMLEAYHGTYQQLSPMPMALRPKDDDDLSDLELSSPVAKRGVNFGDNKSSKNDKLAKDAEKKKARKAVSLYDPEADAKRISEALGRHRSPDTETICNILPFLTHDNVIYLKKAYKKEVKVSGKGVNLAKHLKTKLTGNLSKVAYVTALGRWESEGYWANFWYQSHSSRRELLIESLMGRTNAEIWNIKDEFKDKRYSDDLVTCMEKELKMDKFRTAVLMALEEKRQEEQDVYPIEYRNRDVEMLHRAISAPKGGESTMLEIIVKRSDSHLREVLKTYEKMHGENLARASLKKSSNLVGEVIAHILNGVINKPARDALLLRHAIKDVQDRSSDELRYELLISRLVRLHWDKVHLRRVKDGYEQKYGTELKGDIDKATSGPFADYCYNLCKADQGTSSQS